MTGSDRTAERFARGWRAWLVAALLLLPVVWLYGAHALGAPPGYGPTGFIQYDQLYYMANARELIDRGGLTYGNPFSPGYATAPIYFQPVLLLLAAALRLSGGDPGVLYAIFGAVAGLACLRAVVALYRTAVPLEDAAAWLGLGLFAWGGGLLALAGVYRGWLTGGGGPLAYDPAGGWWFLNLGRNLVYPTEAFHHLLFFGAILLVVRRRWTWATALAGLLSASHPFTGVELLGILFGWAALERFALGNRDVPPWFAGAMALLLVIHGGYYLGFLNTDPEHRALFAQWRGFDAVLEWPTIVLAYGLVALFAAVAAARGALDQPRNRLLAVWFAGAFALANNDLLIDPIQPLHFTRGYVWTPLFLLGAPVLVETLRRFLAEPRLGGKLAAGALAAVLLLDNATWFAVQAQRPPGLFVTADERALFAWLRRPEQRGAVLLASPRLAYMATAYTPLRGWYTHRYNTPDAPRRAGELAHAFATGQLPAGTEGTTFLVIRDAARSRNPRVLPQSRPIYRNSTIAVWRVSRGDRAGWPRP